MSSPYTRYNLGLFNSGTYTPTIVNITNITQSNPAVVTTSIDQTFVVGQEVQFFIPLLWGMNQLQHLTGYVLSIITPTQFSVNIDTTFFDPFITPTPPPFVVIDVPQVAGIGDQNTGTSSPGGIIANPNTIPGAFLNHPP